jgi:hypothetical protein
MENKSFSPGSKDFLVREGVFNGQVIELTNRTMREVDGLFNEKEIDNNKRLRGSVQGLAVALGKSKEYTSEQWLDMGLTAFIPDEELQKLAYSTGESNPEGNSRIKTARYFLNEKLKFASEQSIFKEKISKILHVNVI